MAITSEITVITGTITSELFGFRYITHSTFVFQAKGRKGGIYAETALNLRKSAFNFT